MRKAVLAQSWQQTSVSWTLQCIICIAILHRATYCNISTMHITHLPPNIAWSHNYPFPTLRFCREVAAVGPLLVSAANSAKTFLTVTTCLKIPSRLVASIIFFTSRLPRNVFCICMSTTNRNTNQLSWPIK